MRVPDYLEPITAYRVWDVSPDGLLSGRFHTDLWPPRDRMSARCAAVAPGGAGNPLHIDHQGRWAAPPVAACTCGMYAYRTAARAEDERVLAWVEAAYQGTERLVAVGAVHLWGRLVEHADGYRAQYAYPVSVEIALVGMEWSPLKRDHRSHADVARRMATLYGIDARVGSSAHHSAEAVQRAMETSGNVFLSMPPPRVPVPAFPTFLLNVNPPARIIAVRSPRRYLPVPVAPATATRPSIAQNLMGIAAAFGFGAAPEPEPEQEKDA